MKPSKIINCPFFLQEKEVNGIKFWCYHAGHVLGASMFMIEIAGVKVHTLHWLLKYQSVTTAVLFRAELTGNTIINPTYIIFLLSRFFTLVIFHVRKIVILWLLRFPVFHQMSLSLWVRKKKQSLLWPWYQSLLWFTFFCCTSINSQSIFLDKYMYPVRKLIILFECMHIWMSNWTGLCYHQHL